MPEKKNFARELLEEFRSVTGKGGLMDIILPPVLFLLIGNFAGFQFAMIAALIMAGLIAIFRLLRRQSVLYSLAGFGSVGLAIIIVIILGRSDGFFLPDIVNGGVIVALALVSLLIRKPMVAWTSFLARRWPLEWYWHSHVRPAYSEVTLLWIFFYSIRLFWQVNILQRQDLTGLAMVNTLTGWPAIILLLIFSYIYGTWRLVTLKGPSVEEFERKSPPPWLGQRRGF